uniref:Kinectin 1 n=1 Tax=Myotis myotis TaxID=51298 RepID=A0A7J8AM75_MYOMY|nr:kinectin 1 [Myotis myotis]
MMEFYESTYFIVLIPSVVITVIFLFFWLFMKETLYDEVLAKQKREQKLVPTKTDKKKAEKKKNKKKEIQNGNLHESDSESVPRDFKLSDALAVEDEQLVPVPLNVVETSSSVRERKKKEKKHKPVLEEQVTKESDVSKIPSKKVEPVPVTKQPTPPSETAASKKKPGQKKSKNGSDDQDKKVETLMVPSKKQESLPLHQETKQESGSGKKKVSSKKQKTENVLVDEPLIHATTYIPLMDNADSSPVVKREVVDLIKPNQVEGIQKMGAKKLRVETDKENAEMKFKDFILSLKTMIFSEDEALCVVDLLKEKSGVIQDALKKSSKGELTVLVHQLQEKDKLLAAVKEDAAAMKDRCKQLTQEMMTEKERSNVVIARMKDRIGTLEKEHNVFQNKMHVSYQETQQMQMKFQQVREQMEAEIAHLKQENGILRDAVSNTTNQLENKQSAELNKLRQDYARLVNELTEKTGKLQQEEVQKKNAEQAVTQLKVQLQEAERRREEVQSYIRKRTAEHEAAQQDLQSKFVAKENEVQSLHSKLTDTLVSKQQLEQRLMQLMELEQKRVNKEESLQMQVQDILEQNEALKAQIQQFHSQIAAQDIQNMNFLLKAEVQKLQALANEQAAAAHELEKMHKSIRVKDDKIRLLEEQLQREISNKMEEFKILSDQNKALQLEVQKLQTLVFEQPNKDVVEQMEKCIQEKDEKLKTVEELLETGLIQVATKEEELNAIRTENSSLTKEVQDLKAKQNDQVSFASLVEELKKVIHEKDGKIKSVEELLEAELLKVANKEKTVQLSITSQVQELQNLLKRKEEQMNTLKTVLEEKEKDLANSGKWLQDLQEENESLKAHVQEIAQHNLKEACSASRHEELETVLKEKENEMKRVESMLKERESDLSSKTKLLQEVQDENNLFKSQIEQLKQQNYQQASSFPPHEELLKVISERDKEITGLRNEIDTLKDAVEHQRKKNNERQQHLGAVELEAKEVLKKLFPKVSVPSDLNYSEWLRGFEKKAKECMTGTSGSEEVKVLEHKLKEADEMHTLLQLECEKYKSVLAETEGILQKLQRSVEQEENKWKVKVDESQKTITKMQLSFTSLEHELEQLRRENKDIENLRRERENLEMELEKAEIERSTYVTEVRELKTQLNETLTKLKTEQSERQKVAGDLHKAQQSLDLIQSKIVKAAGDTTVIENSDVSPESESSEKETMSVSLNQTVAQLQQLLQAVNQQLTKEKEHYPVVE